MSHTIFLQDFINQLIAEVSTTIRDQCSWSAELGEYVAAKEFDYHNGIISACQYRLYLF